MDSGARGPGASPLDRQRHDRTRLLVSGYVDDDGRFFRTPVLVTAEHEALETPNGRLTLKTLVNLVSRFADDLSICLPAGHGRIEAEMERLARAAGCRGAAAGGRRGGGGPAPRPAVAASVGGSPAAAAPLGVSMGSFGWVSHVACGRRAAGGGAAADGAADGAAQNPFGAMGAACLGAAEVFKMMLEASGCGRGQVTRHPGHLSFSFLDYSLSRADAPLPRSADAGEIVLAGAGAVGSSFLYAARAAGVVRGTIIAVDCDAVDPTSLNRCPAFFQADVGRPKAEAVEAMSAGALRVEGHNAGLAEYCAGRAAPEAVVSAVDNNAARRRIQAALPRVVFHGATGGATAAASVVKMRENACLCCIFDEAPSREEAISGETGVPLEMVKRAVGEGGAFTEEHLAHVRAAWGSRLGGLERCVGQRFEDVYAREVCGRVPVGAAGAGGPSASAPFVSFFAGLALACEVVKRYSGELRGFPMADERDFLQVGLFSPGSLNLARRVKSPRCALGCSGAAVQGRFAEKWGAGA